jgi:uncharacterized membrane protein
VVTRRRAGLLRRVPAWQQLAVAGLIGAAAAGLAWAHTAAVPAVLVGWDAAAVIYLALVWAAVWGMDATVTARLAGHARGYYQQPIGGIDFNQAQAPAYLDFAYFSFTLGMTFQVSDTNITTSPIRRVALHHALLSYLFGAVILAVAINVAASLLR